MRQTHQEQLEKEALMGAKKLKELLSDPVTFEKWANETLDRSRMRKKGKKRAQKLTRPYAAS